MFLERLIWCCIGFKNTSVNGWTNGKKNPLANAGDIREVNLIPGSGRSPAERNGNPLQYS